MTRERLGGRSQAAFHLAEIGKQAGFDVPAFSAVDADTVRQIEWCDRPHPVPLSGSPEELPSGLDARWSQFADEWLPVIPRLLSALPCGLGLPVLKLSYVADCDPERLSFAGVGWTVVTRERDVGALRAACAQLMRSRYRGYAAYYREAHPSASSVDVGVLGMEFIPKQAVWGSAWGSAAGYFVHCSRNDVDPRLYASMVCSFHHHSRPPLPCWLEEVPGIQLALDILWQLCVSGAAGDHFEVEFCIGGGSVRLTQWRAVPLLTGRMLDTTLAVGEAPAVGTPFSSNVELTGQIRHAEALPLELDRIAREITTSRDEIWVVPYAGAGIDLFRLLVACRLCPGLKLPPLLVSHAGTGPVGHLHAIVPEDPAVSSVVHVPHTVTRDLRPGEHIVYPAARSSTGTLGHA